MQKLLVEDFAANPIGKRMMEGEGDLEGECVAVKSRSWKDYDLPWRTSVKAWPKAIVLRS